MSSATLKTLAEVVAVTEASETEIVAWIEQQWVLPVEEDEQWLFDEADVARINLIRELRRDMAVNEEAMPVVLRLLDQVYGLRHALAELQEAIQGLPEEHRAELEARLRRILDSEGP
jgi:chaperone modulatory protein CbpM